MRVSVVTAILWLVIQTSSFGQAFGVHMGMDGSQFSVPPTLQGLPHSGGSFYSVVPPQPNEAFERYIARIGEKAGLCLIWATRSRIAPDEAPAFLSELKTRLEDRYGKPTFDGLQHPDSFFSRVITARSGFEMEATWSVIQNQDLSKVRLGIKGDEYGLAEVSLLYMFGNTNPAGECDARTGPLKVDDGGL